MSRSSVTQIQRSQLLNRVKSEVKQRQLQSLHRAVLVNLAQDKPPELLRRTWDLEMKIGRRPSVQLSPKAALFPLFQRTQGQLLILSTQGGGKTTTLLQLARRLVISAQEDEQAAIPVFLNLASWQPDGQGITPWLIKQLQYRYGITPDISQAWLVQNQLILLLDGLDQLAFPEQEFCIQAINRWLDSEASSQKIVITGNLTDYQKCQTRLQLRAAILLRKLNDDQIQTYLKGARSRELWHNIEKQPQLLKLARVPLLLTMMTLAYEEILIESWKRLTTDGGRRHYLLNAYIRRQLSRDLPSSVYGKGKEPTPEQTRRWLIWLAHHLHTAQIQQVPAPQYPLIQWISPKISRVALHETNDTTEDYTDFTLDKLSPLWLQTPQQQQQYERGVRVLTGLFWFVIIGVLISIFNGIAGVVCAVIAGFISALVIRMGWIEKLVLRFILWKHDYIPWNYERFLNYAASRLLLQRVNHRYQFIHLILQEHLAKLN